MRLLLEAIILVAVLMLLWFFGFSRVAAMPVSILARPLLYARLFVHDEAAWVAGFLRSEASLIAENKELKAEQARLQTALAGYDFLRQEYRSLAASFGRHPEESLAVLAAVLAKPPQTPYDTLIIDVGRKEGITVGDSVFAESIPIGEVTEVFSRSSKVVLFSSPGKESTVAVGDDALAVSARGEGGGSFSLSLPRDVALKEGDPVFLPGVPPVLFGEVGSVEVRPTDSFKTALIRGPVNIAQLRFVRVVKIDRS